VSDDEKYDAFGRPIEEREGEGPPSESAPPEQPPPRFLPPSEQPPEREAWWAEPGAAAPPSGPSGGFSAPSGGVTADSAGVPAEWPQRVGAAGLDLLVRVGIVVVATLVGALAHVGGNTAGGVGIVVGLVVGGLASLAYAPYMIATRNGQTIGHRATDTRIVKSDGSPLTGGGAFVREVLVKGILFDNVLAWLTFAIAPLLNYLWALWDDRNETLHDKMCNTRVVRA
jgi:uncharacterized RDD family membrane protein YckC